MSEEDLSDRFISIHAKYEQDIRRYIFSLCLNHSDTEDVVQNTSLALWKKFSQYDSSQPFINWACRFAYFEVLKHREKQSKRRQLSKECFELMAEEYVQEVTELDHRRGALDSCLSKLSEEDKTLIDYRYTQGLNVPNISKITGDTCKKLYHKYDRLRQQIMRCVHIQLLKEGHSS